MRKRIRPVVRLSPPAPEGPRLGLCCQFLDAPVHFRHATHRYVATLDAGSARGYLTGILCDNAAALAAAVQHCSDIGIGAFRINSQILPLATHPRSGYRLADIDETGEIRTAFKSAGHWPPSSTFGSRFTPINSWCSIPSGQTSSVRRSAR